jgi:hypothetical protein
MDQPLLKTERHIHAGEYQPFSNEETILKHVSLVVWRTTIFGYLINKPFNMYSFILVTHQTSSAI